VLSGGSPLLMLLVKEVGLVSLVMEEETELGFMPRFPCIELRILMLFVSLLAGDPRGGMLRSGAAGIMVIVPSAPIRFAPCLGVCSVVVVVEFRLLLLELLKLFPGEGVFADADTVSRLRVGLGLLCKLVLVPLLLKLASCSADEEGVQDVDGGITPSSISALEDR
jgi:hypothetical protein